MKIWIFTAFIEANEDGKKHLLKSFEASSKTEASILAAKYLIPILDLEDVIEAKILEYNEDKEFEDRIFDFSELFEDGQRVGEHTYLDFILEEKYSDSFSYLLSPLDEIN